MNNIKQELETYCELHWWNMGKKTLSFKGQLKDLLKTQNITFAKRKSEVEGLYHFSFKNPFGVSYKVQGTIGDFTNNAKKFIQMELVRMGDPSQLYVANTWRPAVTINR